DPPSNNTDSLSPNLLIPTFDSTTDEQPISAEHPTEPTDLISNNDTAASVSSILLMTTSDVSTEAQPSTPKHQNDSTNPTSSNNTGANN
ncbi:hypothetical protein cypCar_00037406, partial [Cyprinus carpio]